MAGTTTVEVYDYSDNKLCTLYDSRLNTRGQAFDVTRKKE